MRFKEDAKRNISIVPVSHIHLYPKVNSPADKKKNKQTNNNEHFKCFIFRYIVITSSHC